MDVVWTQRYLWLSRYYAKSGGSRFFGHAIDKGTGNNSCDKYNGIPWHKASELGHERIVQPLLDNKADISSFDKRGETPVHKAFENGHEVTVQLLLKNGANVY